MHTAICYEMKWFVAIKKICTSPEFQQFNVRSILSAKRNAISILVGYRLTADLCFDARNDCSFQIISFDHGGECLLSKHRASPNCCQHLGSDQREGGLLWCNTGQWWWGANVCTQAHIVSMQQHFQVHTQEESSSTSNIHWFTFMEWTLQTLATFWTIFTMERCNYFRNT